jgi:hypothetical protein
VSWISRSVAPCCLARSMASGSSNSHSGTARRSRSVRVRRARAWTEHAAGSPRVRKAAWRFQAGTLTIHGYRVGPRSKNKWELIPLADRPPAYGCRSARGSAPVRPRRFARSAFSARSPGLAAGALNQSRSLRATSKSERAEEAGGETAGARSAGGAALRAGLTGSAQRDRSTYRFRPLADTV